MVYRNSSQVASIIRHSLILLVFSLLSPVFAASEAGNSDDPITLGDFYYECSRAFRIELPEGWDRSKAWMLLRATGLRVDGEQDMNQPLRHRHVLEIGEQLGIRFSTRDPEQLFTRSQVQAFLTRFHEYFRLPIRKSLRQPERLPPDGKAGSPTQSEESDKD